MKIGNMNFISIYGKQDSLNLAEDSILTAKLIEASNNEILLDLGNGNFLSGKTELSLQGLKNTVLSFLIKSIDNNRIELKLLQDSIYSNEDNFKPMAAITLNNNNEKRSLENTIISNNNNTLNNNILIEENKMTFIKEIIDLYKLEDNNISVEAIKSMMKFEMPLSKESVMNVVRYINKLESIISVNENDKLFLLESNHSPVDINICKIIKSNDKRNIEQQDISRKLEMNNKNITDKILSQTKNLVQENKITPDIIKKVAFLIKSNIDVSINNINQLSDLIDKGNSFEDKISKIFNELASKNLINKDLLDNLRRHMNNIVITFSHQDKEKIDYFYKEIRAIMKLINEQIVNKDNISDELSSKIKEVNDSVNLINKLNEHTTFLYIPFTCKDVNFKNSFYMLSKKKHAKTSDKISIFMRLETNNLKKIEVMCTVINNRINLNFKVEEKFACLFEEKKLVLYDMLESIGYKSVSIHVNKNNNVDILDFMSNNDFVNYKLNIKV